MQERAARATRLGAIFLKQSDSARGRPFAVVQKCGQLRKGTGGLLASRPAWRVACYTALCISPHPPSSLRPHSSFGHGMARSGSRTVPFRTNICTASSCTVSYRSAYRSKQGPGIWGTAAGFCVSYGKNAARQWMGNRWDEAGAGVRSAPVCVHGHTVQRACPTQIHTYSNKTIESVLGGEHVLRKIQWSCPTALCATTSMWERQCALSLSAFSPTFDRSSHR